MTASKAPSALTCLATSLAAGDRRQISDDDGFGLGHGLPGVLGARLVARMQDGLMALISKKPADHQAEAVGRTRDENARHDRLPVLRSAIECGRLAPDDLPAGNGQLDHSDHDK